ncbi:MAG: hypothetical protein H7145_01045, partial [Akkermansiaceae bacterium]|nr:hypothetical protein [Armatimonadota bacterium]
MATGTPYDATTKVLIEEYAEDRIAFLGFPPGAVSLIDADLATVTTEADRFIRVDPVGAPGQTSYIVHIELQSGDMTDLPLRTLRYNVLGAERTGLPVESVAVLLRPATKWRAVTGRLELPGAVTASGPAGAVLCRRLYFERLETQRNVSGVSISGGRTNDGIRDIPENPARR